jgi:phasin
MHRNGAVARCRRNAKAKKGIVQRRIPMNDDRTAKAAREAMDKTTAAGAETARGVQEGLTSAVENVRDLNVRLIDMARANTEAAFDFAHEVATAKAPSDLAQVWSTHTRKQFEMLTKQASELTALYQRFASTTAEPLRAAWQ